MGFRFKCGSMRLVYDPEYYENETFHHFRLQALQGRHKNECIAIVRSLKWKIAGSAVSQGAVGQGAAGYLSGELSCT